MPPAVIAAPAVWAAGATAVGALGGAALAAHGNNKAAQLQANTSREALAAQTAASDKAMRFEYDRMQNEYQQRLAQSQAYRALLARYGVKLPEGTQASTAAGGAAVTPPPKVTLGTLMASPATSSPAASADPTASDALPTTWRDSAPPAPDAIATPPAPTPVQTANFTWDDGPVAAASAPLDPTTLAALMQPRRA